ncbi:MAG: biopolymer transporter ExbD [Bdellovibrionota bacterium]
MAGLTIPSPGSRASGHRRGRARRRRNRSFGLQLTSMMDVFVIIVVFLLKSYGLSIMQVPQQDKLELPKSKATDVFGEGIVIQIAQDKILVDNDTMLTFGSDPKDATKKFVLPEGSMDTKNAGQGIFPIFEILKKKKEDFDTLASRAPDPVEAAKKWTGDLLVQADKEVPYELIRNVMYTAGMAGYKQFRLTVQKQDTD